MDRVTFSSGQIPIKEDYMIMQRYMMQVISRLLVPWLGGGEAIVDRLPGIWLPGPYVAISAAQAAVENLTVSYQRGISWKTSLTTPWIFTFRAPLGLAQAITLDPTDWGDLASDGGPIVVIGLLDTDVSFIVEPPPDPGGSDVNYQTIIYTGKVEFQDTFANVWFFNEDDPSMPLGVNAPVRRLARLTISEHRGNVGLTFPGVDPAISGNEVPLLRLYVSSEGAQIATTLQSGTTVPDFYTEHHKFSGVGFSPDNRIDQQSIKKYIHHMSSTTQPPFGTLAELTGWYGITVPVPDLAQGLHNFVVEADFAVRSEETKVYNVGIFIGTNQVGVSRTITLEAGVWTHNHLQWFLSSADVATWITTETSVVFTLKIGPSSVDAAVELTNEAVETPNTLMVTLTPSQV